MNILIPDSWLREHLKTKATPRQIAEYLSLSSQSVEKINRVGEDWIYEVEVTTNRPDCLSVYGIARELAAILPRFGIKVSLVTRRQGFWTSQDDGQNDASYSNGLPLEVKITDSLLCPRFTAIIFDNIRVAPSPKIVQERLEKVGIRALNNVVDVSNYLMIELGQPMHTFDYDKIGGAKMILREAAGGEKITTLDGQRRILPRGAIVIEDGQRELIDLCGIMGGENSAVDEKTGRVLLFIQTYDPVRIRRTCQQLAFRTEASSRFEKGIDLEGVIPAMERAIEMFKKNCEAKVAGRIIDIYPNPLKPKTIKLDLNLVNKIIGVEIPKDEIINILKSLGFGVGFLSSRAKRGDLSYNKEIASSQTPRNDIISCTVPHWRYSDISISEDLIEEIARIYGYHNLPSNIPSLSYYRHSGLSRIRFWMPPHQTVRGYQNDVSQRFFSEEKVKTALKYWGFSETMSFSMVSEEMLVKVGLEPQDYLKIANPLTSDLVYMRPSLIPSILQIISQNQANFPEVRVFEIANIYIPQGEKSLPEEIPMLTAALTSDRFYEAKGILEALFEDLGIKDYKFRKGTSINKIFHPGKMAEIQVAGKPIGILGEGNTAVTHRFDISDKVIIFDLEINPLIRWATNLRQYISIPVFPATVEDIAFVIYEKVETAKIIEAIKKVDKLIVKVSLLDFYHNTQTFRITYQSPTKTLSGEEVGKIREKIIKAVKEKFEAELKS